MKGRGTRSALAAMLGLVAGLIVSSGSAVAAVGDITEYAIPTPASQPDFIAAGPDGNFWFTESGGNKVGKVTTSGAITEYPVPTSSSHPSGIVAGPDGNLWFTEGEGNKVVKMTTSGAFTEYPVPTANSGPYAIAAGPDGNLWITETNKVARVTTSGVFTEYAIPTAGGFPYAITAGPDGNMWFTEQGANRVAKITTLGVLTEYTVPTGANSFPAGITTGPDGNLWITQQAANKVAKVTTSGVFTEYAIPTPPIGNSWPTGITTGPDGNLWVTQPLSGSKVARLTTSGVFTEYTLPNPSFLPEPWGITAGDGTLWFTEHFGSRIGKVVASQPCTAASVPTTLTASSTSQYSLSNSDGYTWRDIDAANLRLLCNPTANQSTLLTANADLWTSVAGYNQDLAIFVSDNGGADQLLAWKESGGFAGTFSPNAAYVQGLFSMTSGHHYIFKLKWKTNKLAAGATILAAAGGGPIYSPTSLVAETFPTGVVPNFAVSTSQYALPNSDGATWEAIDAANLSTTLAPTASTTAVLGANADLWTANPGYNQDLGIFVSDNTGPDTLVGWKESGGFAGTYSPNAAFVKATYPMMAGHTYKFTLKWKTNKDAAGATIFAAAGGPAYSQTSLLAETVGIPAVASKTVTNQYNLPSSNGVDWQPIDAANLTSSTGTISADTNAIVGGNADLWTAYAGVNQDLGIFVSDNGGPDVLVAWKESGGFAGTYSPNAAFVQAVYPMTSGHTYTFTLKWKSNINNPYARIYVGAGGPGVFSPTRLTIELTN